MKKILIVLLIVLLVLGLVACGNARQKAQEQAVENMLENMLEKESGDDSGGDVDIDVDDGGGSITISDDEGSLNIQSDENGMPWPSDKLPNYVPEVKGVKVVSIIDVGAGISVIFDGIDAKIAEDYIKQVEANGWDITMNMDNEGLHMIFATNGNEEMLNFAWEEEDASGEITYTNP